MSVLCGWQESGKVVSAEQIAMYVFGGNEERRRSIVIYASLFIRIIMTDIKLRN